MNRIDRKKIHSILQTIIRLFRREEKSEPSAHTVSFPENELGDFAVSLKYAVDSNTRKSILMAHIDAERQKAEAIEKARHLFLR